MSKLRVKEISDKVAKLKAATEDGQKVNGAGEDVSDDINFCKQNRWGSYDCILCKTILKTHGQYEQHAQSDFHKRNIEIFKQNNQGKAWTERPIVIMSIMEHNSNVLPWREAGA